MSKFFYIKRLKLKKYENIEKYYIFRSLSFFLKKFKSFQERLVTFYMHELVNRFLLLAVLKILTSYFHANILLDCYLITSL